MTEYKWSSVKGYVLSKRNPHSCLLFSTNGNQLSCNDSLNKTYWTRVRIPPAPQKINDDFELLIDIYIKGYKMKIDKYFIPLVIVLITYANGIVSTKFLNDKNIQLQSLIDENKRLVEKLNEYETEGMHVTVTMYQPVRYQTDSTPNILADGTRIRTKEASNYKFIAVSRNLLKRWGGFLDYGDFVLLKGTDHKDGVYQVRDTMNKRWVNRIDILESVHVKPYKFEKAKIIKTDLVINGSN